MYKDIEQQQKEDLMRALSKMFEAEKRNKVLTIRVKECEKDLIEKRATELNCTMTDYIINLVNIDYNFGVVEKFVKYENREDRLSIEELFGLKQQKVGDPMP